jgi:hypothetical protein
LARGIDGPPVKYTATGWFSCDRCAVSRVKSGRVGPTNRECAQKCLAEGALMVFLDEKAAALFQVDNPEQARGQESHYVRIHGTVDPDVKTVHVDSVEVLQTYVASCGLPRRN